MKRIINKSSAPIRIPLPNNRTLHLGPSKTGQISEQAAERPAVRRLIEAGTVEVVDADAPAAAGERSEGPVHGETHGHQPTKVVLPKGDR